MPSYSSPHWDEKNGCCEKHLIPMLPCPQCIATADPDLDVRLTQTDRLTLGYENEVGDGLEISDLLLNPDLAARVS